MSETTLPDVEVTAPRATNPSQPAGSSWTEKAIDITIRLGTGTFGQTGKNTVKLSNLRMIVSVLKAGYPSMDTATARVYGVTQSVMNSVSTLGIPLTMYRAGNAMLIEAGDKGGAMFTVFNGYLGQAYQNFDDAPETCLELVGWAGQAEAITPTEAVSYSGSVDVATIMSNIAKKQGWNFENNGVKIQVSNPYLWGTAIQQVHDLARTANIEAYLDSGKSPIVLAIWPRYQTRGGTKPLISPQSGLIGYPKFQSSGMSFRCLFNPNIQFGSQIIMQSSTGSTARTVTPGDVSQANASGTNLPPTTNTGGPNGEWYVISPLSYDLSAQMPGGPWFCEVNCQRTNVTAP